MHHLCDNPWTVFCISTHSLSLGETSFSARSYTYSFPSLEPRPALRESGARSKASLLMARGETVVETTGTWMSYDIDSTHLDVLIHIPQIKLARSIHRAKQCRMIRVPFRVKDVIVRLFKRMDRRDRWSSLGRPRCDFASLGSPELDRPIDRASKKQVGKVNVAGTGMKMKARDGTGVTPIHILGV